VQLLHNGGYFNINYKYMHCYDIIKVARNVPKLKERPKPRFLTGFQMTDTSPPSSTRKPNKSGKPKAVTKKYLRGLTTKQQAFVKNFIAKAPLGETKKSIAIASGYAVASATEQACQQLSNPKVQFAIESYIRENSYDDQIKQVYDEILGMDLAIANTVPEQLAIANTKLNVTKELHKIKGSYAPIKSDSRKAVAIFVPNMDED